MKASFDNSFLTLTLARKGAASVPKALELVDDLIEKLDAKNAKVIIPTPTLTEVLLKAPKSGPNYIEKIKEFSCFQIKPFDEKAAVELAERLIASIGTKRTRTDVAKTKVTFDRQIVATSKVHGATEMYSDDAQVRDFAEECGMKAYGFSDLHLTPKQTKFSYDQAQHQSASPGAKITDGQTATKSEKAETKDEEGSKS